MLFVVALNLLLLRGVLGKEYDLTTPQLRTQYNGLCLITYEEAMIDLHGVDDYGHYKKEGCGGRQTYMNLIPASESVGGAKPLYTPWQDVDQVELPLWCFLPGLSTARGDFAWCTSSTGDTGVQLDKECENRFGTDGVCGCAFLQILKKNEPWAPNNRGNSAFVAFMDDNLYRYQSVAGGEGMSINPREQLLNREERWEMEKECATNGNNNGWGKGTGGVVWENMLGMPPITTSTASPPPTSPPPSTAVTTSTPTTTTETTKTETTTTTYPHTDHPIHWKQQYDGLCFITFKEAQFDLHGKTSENTPKNSGCDGKMDYFKTTSESRIYISEQYIHETEGKHEWDHWCFPSEPGKTGGKTSARDDYAYCKPASTEINTQMTQRCNDLHSELTGQMCGCAKMQILKQDITVEIVDAMIVTNPDIRYTTLDDAFRASFLSATDASVLLFDECESQLAGVNRTNGPLFDLAGTNITTTTGPTTTRTTGPTTTRTTTTVAADAGASKTSDLPASVIVIAAVAGIVAIALLIWLYYKSKMSTKSTLGRGMKSSLESVFL